MTPNDTPEPGKVPAPLPPPPEGLLHLIMRHRFLIVCLVVVLLYALKYRAFCATAPATSDPVGGH